MKRSSSISSSDRRALIKLLCFLALLLSITVAGYFAISALHHREQQSWRVQDNMVTDFYAQEKDSLNTLFIGSSRMMCSVIPTVMEDALPGMRCFNLGASSQMPDTTYHLLCAALDRQKPDYVVMDLYYAFAAKEHDQAQSTLIFKPMPLCRQKILMFFDLFTKEERELLLKTWFNPFYRMKNAGIYNLQLSLGLTEEAVDTSGTYEDRGFFSLGDRVVDVAEMTAKYTGQPETYSGLSATQTEYIRRIAEVCQERGIKLLFVSTPMTPSYIPLNPVLERAGADIRALCDELGVPFMDFSASAAEMGLTDAHFADRVHFNRAGAQSYSEIFAAYLADSGFYAPKKGN
ncbi:MAG: hypothetical protein IKL89_08990 [Clostridia bacterium]|nr:hypothetical protein [Clostridia bacterium]